MKSINKKIIVNIFVFIFISNILVASANINYNDTSTNLSLNKSYSSSGVTIYKESCCEGYTLLNIQSSHNWRVSLIDMNGTEVKSWQFDTIAKMLPGGNLIGVNYMLKNTLVGKDITEINWDGKVLWSFTNWTIFNGEMYSRIHHDFQREGNPAGYYAPGQNFVENGTTLVLGNKNKFVPKISNTELIDDVIYEVDWNGDLTGFEWNASDHINQMGFSLFERIGIYLNPGLMLSKGDWCHINSISELGKNKWYDAGDERFNPKNIILDSRNCNFIIIIDRKTGDIVWKVGPNFGTANPSSNGKLGQLIGLHNAHMIPEGLPGAGNILVFDNGGAAGYGIFGVPNRYKLWSRVVEFNPITLDIVWEYRAKNFFSFFVGSAQRLPNGNTLITEGDHIDCGRVFEVSPNKEIVWEYFMPPNEYLYRSYRIPPEWVPGNPEGYPLWED